MPKRSLIESEAARFVGRMPETERRARPTAARELGESGTHGCVEKPPSVSAAGGGSFTVSVRPSARLFYLGFEQAQVHPAQRHLNDLYFDAVIITDHEIPLRECAIPAKPIEQFMNGGMGKRRL